MHLKSQRGLAAAKNRTKALVATHVDTLPQEIDELLHLAGVSAENADARRWLRDALEAARSRRQSPPTPAQHNKPLVAVEEAAQRLAAAIRSLKGTPHAYWDFCRLWSRGPVHNNQFEGRDILADLKAIGAAAIKARIKKTGRPRNLRKQQIVDLALAFCVRFSVARPSRDANNYFPAFAERFVELATGLSAESKGQGIGRQIEKALKDAAR